MMDLRCLVGAAAMTLAGCANTVSPAREDASAAPADAVDVSDAGDAGEAADAGDARDARDADIDRPDVDPACPPSPPRSGRCAPAGLACTYPNGCTFRCEGFNDSGAGAWFSLGRCF